ncbi:MAG TPA: hypothetical protein VHQ87_10705, partial [Rhizobacter sp.]|jgi:hypothetical protein|nr:hypothetical protein [Rhizobacter sp.]
VAPPVTGTPVGLRNSVNTLVATTVPHSVVPSTPGLSPLFTGRLNSDNIAPQIQEAYASPQVLTVQDPDAPQPAAKP